MHNNIDNYLGQYFSNTLEMKIVTYDLLVESYDFISIRQRLRHIVTFDVQIVQCIAGVASYDEVFRFCFDASQQNRKNRCQGHFNDASKQNRKDQPIGDEASLYYISILQTPAGKTKAVTYDL